MCSHPSPTTTSTLVHGCDPLITAADTQRIVWPQPSQQQQRLVLRYHCLPPSQQLMAGSSLPSLTFLSSQSEPVVSTSYLQVVANNSALSSPGPKGRLNRSVVVQQIGRPTSGAADSIVSRKQLEQQQVILQRLNITNSSLGPPSPSPVRPLSADSPALASGVKTVMRTTLVPRTAAATSSSYSDAQINSILQQMVPEPPRAETLNTEGQERAKAMAAAVVSNLETRQLPPTASTPPPAVSPYDRQTSPMIQPLELLPDTGLDSRGEEMEVESLENVVLPVLPEHLPDFQMPKVGLAGSTERIVFL